MAKVTAFSKSSCKDVASEAMKALEAVAKQYGLDIERGNGRFSEDQFGFKITFKTAKTEDMKSDASTEFKRHARLLNVDPTWYGRQFRSKTKIFTVSALKPRAHKNCVVIVDQKGNSFVCTPSYVASHLK